MNRLKPEKRLQILQLHLEGMSLRAIQRISGVSINTVMNLLREASWCCADFMRSTFANLDLDDVQVDELWTYVGRKEKNWTPSNPAWSGSVFIWTAIGVDSRLFFSWHVARRNQLNADIFLSDIAAKLGGGPARITSDSYGAYVGNIHNFFPNGLEYFARVKGQPSAKVWRSCRPQIFEEVAAKDFGVHTNYAEVHNKTMRLHMKRLQRFSGCNSKEIGPLVSAVALYAMFYNFCRPHKTLKTTPAIAAGLSNRMWRAEDIVELLEARELALDAMRPPRGPYKSKHKPSVEKVPVQFSRRKDFFRTEEFVVPAGANADLIRELHGAEIREAAE